MKNGGPGGTAFSIDINTLTESGTLNHCNDYQQVTGSNVPLNKPGSPNHSRLARHSNRRVAQGDNSSPGIVAGRNASHKQPSIGRRENLKNTFNQLLTPSDPKNSENSVSEQNISSLHSVVDRLITSLEVRNPTNIQSPIVAQPRPSKAGGAAVRSSAQPIKRRKKRKGGWPARTGLTWPEVKQVSDLYHAAHQAGIPLNVLVTIQPAAITDDALRKRYCSRKIAHIGQALKRRGQAHIGVTTFEKELNGELHAHHLVHIAAKNIDVVERWADGLIIHARKAVPSDPGYITKHRLPGSPEFEAWVNHRRSP